MVNWTGNGFKDSWIWGKLNKIFQIFSFIQSWESHTFPASPKRLALHPHSLSLTSGTAQWCGHSSVHDEHCTVQPRAVHGHLDLLNARVQSSLPGLLSGEDGVALAADLSGRWTHYRGGRCKVCGEGGWMDSSRKERCRRNKRNQKYSREFSHH